jgi:hypothetical protein
MPATLSAGWMLFASCLHIELLTVKAVTCSAQVRALHIRPLPMFSKSAIVGGMPQSKVTVLPGDGMRQHLPPCNASVHPHTKHAMAVHFNSCAAVQIRKALAGVLSDSGFRRRSTSIRSSSSNKVPHV